MVVQERRLLILNEIVLLCFREKMKSHGVNLSIFS